MLSILFCVDCGNAFPIQRRSGRGRKRGHIKHLWCIRCKRVQPHSENKRITRKEYQNDRNPAGK